MTQDQVKSQLCRAYCDLSGQDLISAAFVKTQAGHNTNQTLGAQPITSRPRSTWTCIRNVLSALQEMDIRRPTTGRLATATRPDHQTGHSRTARRNHPMGSRRPKTTGRIDMTKNKLSIADKLASLGACPEAVDWVRKHDQQSEQEMWDDCIR